MKKLYLLLAILLIGFTSCAPIDTDSETDNSLREKGDYATGEEGQLPCEPDDED